MEAKRHLSRRDLGRGTDAVKPLRTPLPDADIGPVLQAARALYPAMAPSPTGEGYWHIRTRRDFHVPYFGRTSPAADVSACGEFCALYFRRDRGAHRDEESEGTLQTLFLGRFDDDDYDTVDRTFRVLTDELLEPAGHKLNRRRGRRRGGVAGSVIGIAAPLAVMGWGMLDVAYVPDAVQAALDVVPVAYRKLTVFCGGLVLLAACSSVLGTLGAWIGAGIGHLCERGRLRRLAPGAVSYVYGHEAAEQIRRELAVLTGEKAKQREFDRLRMADVELTPDDFLKVYDVLPYLRQLGMTEQQRREEVETLTAKLGRDFPVSVMQLAEPYVSDGGRG